ncbi:MAG TPA: hypothetical protein VNN62_16990 [Methylomirabilota bacterium]|jgi:hypothetical protein|nr:hypothetical protein [Methylomirabilota bacterium]
MSSVLRARDKEALLRAPLATLQLIKLAATEETALAMRTADLFSFRRPGISVSAQLLGYQAKEGVWVVAVHFCALGSFSTPLTGIVYLNPQEPRVLELLYPLARQERLPLLLFSPQLKITIRQQAPWSVQQRQEARLLLAHLRHYAGEGVSLTSMQGAEFERARQEFERVYAGKSAPSLTLSSSQTLLSSFRGVVLE